jgi:hypothetical protein
MIGVIAWAVAIVFGVVVGAVLAYGLAGHRARLRTTIEAARADLEPSLEALRAEPATGRHSVTALPGSSTPRPDRDFYGPSRALRN